MLEAKIQEVPQVECREFAPLKMVSVHTKEEHQAKVKVGALKPAGKQEQINLQVLTKLIEHIEKNL